MSLREHTTTMRALAYREGKLQFLKDEPVPDLQPGQALLKIRQAGLCNTDMELVRGYMGFSGILGHALGPNRVDPCNAFDRWLAGDRAQHRVPEIL